MGVSAVFALWVCVVFLKPSWIVVFPWAMPMPILFALFFSFLRWMQRVDPGKVNREIDRRLGLPDVVLSAEELPGDDAWRAALHREAITRTCAVNWKEIWPVLWPKWTRAAAVCCIALTTLLGYQFFSYQEHLRYLANNPPPRDPRTVALEEMFKNWDEVKELEKMMEQIAPIRERLLDLNSSEKQQFADIVRLEEIIAAERAKLDALSLEPQAGNLADALQPMEGMGALAAALRKKDFDKAVELAKEAAARLANGEVPKGSKEAGEAMQKLAQKIDNQAMCQALNKFCQGAKQGDCKQMSTGMNNMQQCFSQQAARNAERKRLSTQLAQLSYSKNPDQGQGAGMNRFPRISSSKPQEPGEGAGSETDLNRFGVATQLDSERHREEMQNTVGEGESETRTLKSVDGQTESARGTAAVSFQEYQRLSQQAIADEALPAAHRESIKRYFEKIRPESPK